MKHNNGLLLGMLLLGLLLNGCKGKVENDQLLLFDGKDVRAWRSVNGDSFPATGWTVKDSLLCSLPGYLGGDIITRERFADFDLALEYKLTDSANTGIKYLVVPYQDGTGKEVYIGPEFQLIDDFKHEVVVDEKNPTMSTAALYLLYAPEGKHLRPAGEWNSVRIRVLGSKVEHWLNGERVVAYERATPAFRAAVKQTKFSPYKGYGEHKEGHILLQDHGDQVFFRNIKLKRL